MLGFGLLTPEDTPPSHFETLEHPDCMVRFKVELEYCYCVELQSSRIYYAI